MLVSEYAIYYRDSLPHDIMRLSKVKSDAQMFQEGTPQSQALALGALEAAEYADLKVGTLRRSYGDVEMTVSKAIRNEIDHVHANKREEIAASTGGGVPSGAEVAQTFADEAIAVALDDLDLPQQETFDLRF